MPDETNDSEDLWLESLFASEPIADDGFSQRVVHRIRRRLWLRGLALPLAVVTGGAIAARPAADLATRTAEAIAGVSQAAVDMAPGSVPWAAALAVGGVLFVLSVVAPPLADL